MSDPLKPGKLVLKNLSEILAIASSSLNNEVIVPPGVGLDAAVIKLSDNLALAISSDPITAATENIGYYVVHVNANDIAAIGGDPKWMIVDLFLPEGSTQDIARGVIKEITENLREIRVSLVGGHTEVTPGIDRPIIGGTMIGTLSPQKVTPSSKARAGDLIILTKWAGLEGTAIISKERKEELLNRGLTEEEISQGAKLIKFLSVLREARLARELAPNLTHAMHDVTEGGVLGGVFEMSLASNLGFELWKDEIPFLPLTMKLCQLFNLDPLALISSGALLISISPEGLSQLTSLFDANGIPWKVIGKFLEDPKRRYIVSSGKREEAYFPERDEIWKLF